MAELSKAGPAAERPAAWRSLASKFSFFSAALVFWVIATTLAYDLRRDSFDAGRALLLLVVVVLVAAAISRFTTRLMARPLRRLQDGIAAVQNGRLERIEVSRTGDEIEFLGESFNRMIDALAASEKRIAEHQEFLERRIQERTRQLEQALRAAQEANETKSEFLANVSHELRTPVHGVIGMLELMRDSAPAPELAEHLQTAHGCASFVLTLLNDLLDLSKIEAGKMTLEKVPFELRGLVEDCIQSHQPAAARNAVELRFEISQNVPERIAGDPLRIRQILGNLVSNAVKFTEHGTVDVRLDGAFSQEQRFTLTLSVQDSGTGIPADKLLYIFDKFTQADDSVSRKYGGTGLGLAITRKLVQLHGGEIRVSSELGRGSTFTATLLCDGAVSGDIRPASGQPAAGRLIHPASALARILVVEDNSVNQKVVTSVLGKRGFSVELANDGEQALARLRSGVQFDLILMDVQMPKLDGLEATRIIRQNAHWKAVPIIAMTAHAMLGDKERCLEAGMNGYISKPVHPEHLLKTIDEFLFFQTTRSVLSNCTLGASQATIR